MKILAVDDDESILELLDHTLSISAHHEVTTAASAAQAMQKLAQSPDGFDCFLIDIQMPEVDGIDLTRRIRDTEGYEKKPVLMLTAMHERPYLDRAFQAGATDYITKPFNFRDLRRRIFEARDRGLADDGPAPAATEGRSVVWLRGELIHEGPLAPSDRAAIPAQLSEREFENYAQEIARGFVKATAERRMGGPAVIGLKLANPTLDRAESDLAHVTEALRQVTPVARQVLGKGLMAVSYRGNGSFICMLQKHLADSSGTVEREMNMQMQAAFRAVSPAGLQVFVGNQVPIRTATPSSVLDILWMASESVEQRFLSRRAPAARPRAS